MHRLVEHGFAYNRTHCQANKISVYYGCKSISKNRQWLHLRRRFIGRFCTTSILGFLCMPHDQPESGSISIGEQKLKQQLH
jgi:hypothetical protein